MRMILFFDLPVTTAANRKDYRHFRRFLLKEGYLMLQESVYSKLVLNPTNANLAAEKVKKNRPPSGLVQLLIITEKQYASIENICGNLKSTQLDSMDRLVIL
ncbi:MAG: CRISPR-associated endonuclease Cas2 [Clostridiales bacterium]|nr:CRISPR-associated endonuclease Cas2 [Clostridiales bacterium]